MTCASQGEGSSGGTSLGIRGPVRAGVIGVVVTASLAVVIPASALPESAEVARRFRVASGVMYTKIVDGVGPWVIHMLKVRPLAASSVDPVLAGSTVGVDDDTSDIGARVGAAAAVNGDFGGRNGWPSHGFATDGVLITSGTYGGAVMGLREDKTGGSSSSRNVAIWAVDSYARHRRHRYRRVERRCAAW